MSTNIDLAEYIEDRKFELNREIASERLAGNKWKEECARCALAEITCLENWLVQAT